MGTLSRPTNSSRSGGSTPIGSTGRCARAGSYRSTRTRPACRVASPGLAGSLSLGDIAGPSWAAGVSGRGRRGPFLATTRAQGGCPPTPSPAGRRAAASDDWTMIKHRRALRRDRLAPFAERKSPPVDNLPERRPPTRPNPADFDTLTDMFRATLAGGRRERFATHERIRGGAFAPARIAPGARNPDPTAPGVAGRIATRCALPGAGTESDLRPPVAAFAQRRLGLGRHRARDLSPAGGRTWAWGRWSGPTSSTTRIRASGRWCGGSARSGPRTSPSGRRWRTSGRSAPGWRRSRTRGDDRQPPGGHRPGLRGGDRAGRPVRRGRGPGHPGPGPGGAPARPGRRARLPAGPDRGPHRGVDPERRAGRARGLRGGGRAARVAPLAVVVWWRGPRPQPGRGASDPCRPCRRFRGPTERAPGSGPGGSSPRGSATSRRARRRAPVSRRRESPRPRPAPRRHRPRPAPSWLG